MRHIFIPKVWAEGQKLFIQVNPNEAIEHPIDAHGIYLGIGAIKRILQKEHTVYVQGEHRDVIVANIHSTKVMKVVSPYSIDVPTWMKTEFEEFVRNEE